MAKKNVKMFSDFVKAVSPTYDTTVSYKVDEEQSFDVQIKNRMTINEKSTFIDRVVNGCFDDGDDFRPEFKDAIFQTTILQMLTNVPVFTVKVDEIHDNGENTGKKIEIIDIDKTYDLCKCLNLYDKCEDRMFCSLYDELYHLVDSKIIFKQQRVLMGEKKNLEKMIAEMEAGIEMINSTGDLLNSALNDSFQNGNPLNTISEFSKRMENMSDKQLIESILNK